ncbi:platelet glycoprotein Ib alpha chain [Trichomycterus rosablanca]|uniref:platelet glycoprotein Ib alpha chain n=1 Tax=Trichomycterus rosablanca TaxID=2290929 RepID=UPI002F35FF99
MELLAEEAGVFGDNEASVNAGESSVMLLLLLFIVQDPMVTSGGGCPNDTNKDHRPRVSCVSQGLGAVPDEVHLGTEVLVLTKNRFLSLTWSSYSRFTHLHELDLNQNLITTVQPPGPVLAKLHVLRLSNNKLSGLGPKAFSSAPNLMEVYLDGNALRVLDESTFGDLPHLEVINLSRNELHVLPPRLLDLVSSGTLKTFDLEGNRVQQLPDGFFTSKPELPYVYLSQNSWVCTCLVGYLQRFLDDQGHNIYRHTGPTSIENDPESVVCATPTQLEGRAIVDLKEDEYCRRDVHPSFATTRPTTPTTIKTIVHTTVLRSVWTRLESWTMMYVWTFKSDHHLTATQRTFLAPTTATPDPGDPKLPSSTPLTTTALPSVHSSAYGGTQRSVPWCWWLFITFLLLSILSGIFSCVLFLWLIVTYIKLYRPIKRQLFTTRRNETVTLMRYKTTGEGETSMTDEVQEKLVPFLPQKMIRDVQPVFRSVLFISKEDEGDEDGGENTGSAGYDAATKIELVPSVTLRRGAGEGGTDRKEVFRKTLYRVISREEEIDGWKEVEKSSWGVAQSAGAGSEGKTRYSLILREERGGTVEDRKSEVEWLMGEWEMGGAGGGGMNQGSWGSLVRRMEGWSLPDSAHPDTPENVAQTPV